MTVVVATLMCDRKRHSEMVGLPAMLRLRGDCAFYVNYESTDDLAWDASRWALADEFKGGKGRRIDFERWERMSTWLTRPAYDQDQARLEPICIARNMARGYAIATGATHLLFVDADVVVQPDGLERLLALNVPLCGGYVPGRGAHKHAHYVFGERMRRDNLIYCKHGTLGYALIRRDLFEVLPFRHGPHPLPEHRGTYLSEDPAFAADAEVYYGAEWVIDINCTAEHVDNPAEPLTLGTAATGGHL